MNGLKSLDDFLLQGKTSGKKWASGTTTSGIVSGLTFRPSIVIIYASKIGTYNEAYRYVYQSELVGIKNTSSRYFQNFGTYVMENQASNITVSGQPTASEAWSITDNGFNFSMGFTSTGFTYKWIAFE